jgi:NADPH-dependent 2,4-dienoyl-CoA reductase/sulfur reductase-like enzyme
MFLLNKSFFFFFGIWIISVGIELVLGTRVKLADLRCKTLLTAAGETISYKILIIATSARVLELIFNRLIFNYLFFF